MVRILCLVLIMSNILFSNEADPYVIVLGVAQDGGVPHAGCTKTCCAESWNDPEKQFRVSCLGIVDPQTNEVWMIDATPDFPKQYHVLTQNGNCSLKGILLTHAHIGHYTGLMHLGREVMNAKSLPVYVMPGMKTFLESNGPWDQLVTLGQIELKPIKNKSTQPLNERISVNPFLVPHRDEYSETVGYRVVGPSRSLVYIPDIDKWENWDRDIGEVILENDYILIDGTFFGDGEIPNRSMEEIPHPFIIESMERFNNLSEEEKSKIRFIHLNHTNPALNNESAERKSMTLKGLKVARRNEKFKL